MLEFRRIVSLLLKLIMFAFVLINVKAVDFKFQQTDYQMKFERKDLVRINKEYVKFYKLFTYKYNRTTPVVNETFEYNVDLGFELEIVVQAYVFRSNEYRYFPIRLEVNYCEAIAKDYVGEGKMTKCGNFTGCPIKKGIVSHCCLWSPNPSQFPPLIPDGKYMLELQALYHDKEVWVMRAYGTVYRPIQIPILEANKPRRKHH